MKRVLKAVSVLVALILCLSAASCTNTQVITSTPPDESKPAASSAPTPAASTAGTVSLVLWGSQYDQAMLKEMVEAFKAANPDRTYNIEVRVQGEDEARTTVLQDPAAAGDVFAIPHDQLGALVEAGTVYPNTKYVNEIEAVTVDGAITAAKYNGQMYGYPISAETYFLYYDNSFFTEDDVKSLDTMIEKANSAGKKVGIDLGSAYFGVSFFFANDVLLFGESGSEVDNVTFNSPEGVAVAEYLTTVKNRGLLSINDSEAVSQLENGALAAQITGPWKAADYRPALGDNYGVSKLPAINLNGAEKQMKSFAGFKLYCVKATTAFPEEAMALAMFLTNQENQLKRFNDRDLLPVNKNLSNDPAITEDATVKAVVDQLNYAVAMPSIPEMSNFWTPTGAVVTDLYNGVISSADIQAKLDELVELIKAPVTQ